MNTTRRSIRYRAITLRSIRRPLSDRHLRSVMVGPAGHIRSTDLLGDLAPEHTNFNIDGCDWRGAAYIYFKFSPYHSALADGDCFYFMTPGSRTDNEPVLDRKSVALIVLHHLYTIFLDRGLVPPFRTGLHSKIQYMTLLLKSEPCENELFAIQKGLGYTAFRTWENFFRYIDAMNHEAVKDLLTEEERSKRLELLIKNYGELLEFLKAPVDQTDTIVDQLEFVGETDPSLTNLVLEKLDWHEIYIVTEQEPIAIDWIHRLDVILNRSRD